MQAVAHRFVQLLTSKLIMINDRAVFAPNGKEDPKRVVGTLLGVDGYGHLLMRGLDGKDHTFMSGELLPFGEGGV